MSVVYDKLINIYESIKPRIPFEPKVALILGSGLGNFADAIANPTYINYSEIEGFPVSTAPGHVGRFVFGQIDGVNIVCMQGRVHYYEGYDVTDVVLPIRLMKLFGAKILFLTNAAGGINPDFIAGDLMAISDHIIYNVPSPLRGENIIELGTRFPDMSHVYDSGLRELAFECAKEIGFELKSGVYIQSPGPQYETPAEIRAFKTMGADAVGMSTAIEAVAANHMGMRIIGISCISNLAAGISPTPLSEQEVLDAAAMVAPRFSSLVKEIIKRA